MKFGLFLVVLGIWSVSSLSDEKKFSTHLHAKFHVKACTNCHDFFIKKRREPLLTIHKDITPDMCLGCHDKSVTGFKDEDSGLPDLVSTLRDGAKQTCEAIRKIYMPSSKMTHC